MLDATEK